LYNYPGGTNFPKNWQICVYNVNVDNGVPDRVLKKAAVIQSPKMKYTQTGSTYTNTTGPS